MSRGRVLLLEDDHALRGLLLELLALEDFEVRACDSYDALRDAAGRREGDLIVADFWGGGQRTLGDTGRAQIRELTEMLPLVLLTGRTWATDTSAEELGARALVRKPFDLEELLTVLSRALQSGS